MYKYKKIKTKTKQSNYKSIKSVNQLIIIIIIIRPLQLDYL